MNTKRVSRWVVRVHTMRLDMPPEKQMGYVKAELLKLPHDERALAQQIYTLGVEVARAMLEAEKKKTRWIAGGVTLLGALGSTGLVNGWFGTAQRCVPGEVRTCPAAVPSTQVCDARGSRFGDCLPMIKAAGAGSGQGHSSRDAGP